MAGRGRKRRVGSQGGSGGISLLGRKLGLIGSVKAGDVSGVAEVGRNEEWWAVGDTETVGEIGGAEGLGILARIRREGI